MLFRFSLYGFLKNQRYFEPFFLLLLLDKGLSFFTVGLLIAFRDVMVNLLEIPSGAIADLGGRRKSMVLSFAAYIVSFVLFGAATGVGTLFVAMLFFAVGEAFRTGTHKAMIFAWLRIQGRTDERVRVYGYTRSWSKFGSAVSVLLAGLFVLLSDDYSLVFYVSVVPYALDMLNLISYPAELDCVSERPATLRGVLGHAVQTLKASLRQTSLRRLMAESMGFEGLFHAVKDYLQPILVTVAVTFAAGFPLTGGLAERQQSALLVAPVYFLLHLLSAFSSRRAHDLVARAGGDRRAARWLWGAAVVVFAAMSISAAVELSTLLIASFVVLHMLQNFWRPVLISRFDTFGSEARGATLLSVESQARRLGTVILAPGLGLAVDAAGSAGTVSPFLPVALVGLLVTAVFLATARRDGAGGHPRRGIASSS